MGRTLERRIRKIERALIEPPPRVTAHVWFVEKPLPAGDPRLTADLEIEMLNPPHGYECVRGRAYVSQFATVCFIDGSPETWRKALAYLRADQTYFDPEWYAVEWLTFNVEGKPDEASFRIIFSHYKQPAPVQETGKVFEFNFGGHAEQQADDTEPLVLPAPWLRNILTIGDN